MIDNKRLIDELKSYFGFDKFKGDQEAIIQNLLQEHDTFVLMPTGGGKSLCYQLPALMMEGTAIVISPLIALMKNQVDAMRHYSEEDGIAHFLNSSLNKQQIEQVREDVVSGKTRLLYVAPESLTKEENVDFLKSVKISFYAVDEAHCISEWGHDFRPEYRRIRPIINAIGSRPIIALTATATPKVQHDIQKNLGMTDAKVFKSSFNRPNLYYEVRPKTKDIDKDIIKFIKANEGKSGIIYCLSRKRVEDLAELLRVNGIKALAYHAGMDSATRSENQDKFLLEEVDVIVATIAFGMGIDKPDVRFVIHYDIPKSLEGYYQETGRAGRDGGEGKCITFYAKKDLLKLEKFMQGKPLNEQEIGKQLLNETAYYAESSVCRRKTLLHYFGEPYNEDNCGNCDNCIHPRKRIEASDELCAAIEAIIVLKERFKTEYIVDVIGGNATNEVKSYKHHELEIFGTADGRDENFLTSVVRQGVLSGYIRKDIENYGVLKATEKGKKFLEHPEPFMVVEDKQFSDNDGEEHSGSSAVLDPALFSMLKDLRKEISQQMKLPPYVIFQDPSLEAMATTNSSSFLGWARARPNDMDRSLSNSSSAMSTRTRLSGPRTSACAPWPARATSKFISSQAPTARLDLTSWPRTRAWTWTSCLTSSRPSSTAGTRSTSDIMSTRSWTRTFTTTSTTTSARARAMTCRRQSTNSETTTPRRKSVLSASNS